MSRKKFVYTATSTGLPIYQEMVDGEVWVHTFTGGVHKITAFDAFGTMLDSWDTSMRWGRKITA